MELVQDHLERERLYSTLLTLGNIYPLNRFFDSVAVEQQTAQFAKDWHQYNPRKVPNPRYGLSLTSLKGGLDGVPDLDSLSEYNKSHGTSYSEVSFREPTAVLQQCESLRKPLEPFLPFLGRSHLIKLKEGGYFPFHRDCAFVGPQTIRLISPLKDCTTSAYCFLYDRERIYLDMGQLYFMNTKVEHAVFSFHPNVTLLVLNVIVCQESIDLILKSLHTN